MSSYQNHRTPWLAMIAILLLATLFGGYRLDADPLWVDEVISIQRAGLATYVDAWSPVAVWQRTATISDQVPGYYILLAIWGQVVGTTPFALRVLSLLFGILSIALTYQIGTHLHSHTAGVIAALLMTASAFYMLFLHEMRTYSLVVCLIATLIWCYWLLIHGQHRWWQRIGLVLATAGLMYAYYLSIVVIASLCLYHLLLVRKDRAWWRVVTLFGSAGLLFLPWFITSFSVFDDTIRNDMRTIHTVDFLAALHKTASAFSNQSLLLMGLLLLFVGVRRQSGRFAWFLVISCITLMIALNQPFGVFVNLRYTLVLWVPLALLIGIGASQLHQRGIPRTALIAIILVGAFVSNFSDDLQAQYDLPIRYLPWDTLTDTIAPYATNGDALTFIAAIEGNDWEGVHEERVMPHYFQGSPIEPIFIEDVRNLADEAFLAEATRTAQAHDRIWLSYDPDLRSWRTGLFEQRLLAQGFNLCGTFTDTEALYLDFYAHPNAISNRDTIQFGDATATHAHLIPLHDIPASLDDSLHLTHSWQLSDDFPRYQYSLAVHIIDDTGALVTQADYGVPDTAFTCEHVYIDLTELPAGNYQVRVFAYDWQTNERLSLTQQLSERNATAILTPQQVDLYTKFGLFTYCDCQIQPLINTRDQYFDRYLLVSEEPPTQPTQPYAILGEFTIED